MNGFVAVLLAGCACVCSAQTPEDSSATQRYILRFRQSSGARHGQQALQGLRGRQHIMERVGMVTVDATADEVRRLQSAGDLELIAPDRTVHASGDLIADTINAEIVWTAGHTGAGVGVAVIDSGINSQYQDLGNPSGQTAGSYSRVVYRENFLVAATDAAGKVNPARSQTRDDYGHGTHVAASIAGNGYLSLQPGSIRSLAGIAPNALLIDLKVLDKNGQGSDSNVIAAIDRAIALRSTYNIRVINLSLGRAVATSFAQDPLCQAVEAAWNAGIVVVVAAGNDGRNASYGVNGYGTIDSPGNDPLAITVGAMRTAGTPQRNDDEIATYSSRGPSAIDHIVKPDLVAPGNLIDSGRSDGSYLTKNYPQNNVDPLTVYDPGAIAQYVQTQDPWTLPSYFMKPSYFTLSGTSMAAAVTSGAVALLLDSDPSLTPDQVKARLMLTASKNFTNFGPFYFDYTLKAQKLNLQAQHETVFVLPAIQHQVNQAQQQANTAAATLQQAQGALTTAGAALPKAQQTLDTATQAAAAAQQDYNTAQALDTQLRAASKQAESTWQTSLKAAQDAQQKANKDTDPPTKAADQAQADQLAAQAKKAYAAFLSAAAAAMKQDFALAAAKSTLDASNKALKSAQAALQQAQAAITAATKKVTDAQNQVKNAPANLTNAQANLAAEQANIATLHQEAAAYLAQSGAGSTPYVSQYDIFTVGAGYLDIEAAVESSETAPAGASATSPVAYYDAATDTVQITDYVTQCANPATGDATLWGPGVCNNDQVFGSNVLWGSRGGSRVGSRAFATNTVFGSTLLSASNVLWGSKSGSWGRRGTSAFGVVWGASAILAAGSPSTSNSILIDGDLRP